MFKHPFAYVMVVTFLAAVATMLFGVLNTANPHASNVPAASRKHPAGTPLPTSLSTRLMGLRVALCAALLAEIIIYINYFRP